MANYKRDVFIQSIKGKIIVASVLACFALLLAWAVSRVAFRQMLGVVDNISAPNDKLRLVNELIHKITRLDEVQNSQLLNDPAKYYSFFNESNKLSLTIDTLQTLYTADRLRVKQLNSLKKLLKDRDKLFINYLKVREGLVNNKAFSIQLKTLNRLVSKSANQSDSTVTTTEKKTSTTTIYPPATQDDQRGFLSKLFGKKRPKTANENSYKVVDEELHVKHDTLAKAVQDSIIRRLGETMHRMEKTQRLKSELFVAREATLIKANNKLIYRILAILKQVQNEAVTQIASNSGAAKNAVGRGITRITIIILAFFILTAILLYYILLDLSRSNTYRRELEQARDEAEYHSQAKQRFLSNMSHEIRTPLQSIIGYAGLIKQQEHPRKKDIDAIYQSSEHLMQIVNEVLDYNRIISGKFTFSEQVFNMAALLDEVVSVLRFQAGEKAINFVTDYQVPETDYMLGDPFRLKQVLYNLLGNAIKFTGNGEVKLSVTGDRQEEYLQYKFSVTDTGPGLSEKDIKRIFDEFEQAENNQTSNHGAGLGLAISKALVEGQGGTLSVKSKLGSGSSFSFNIKYKKAGKPAGESEERINAPAGGVSEFKVWIIDDDTFILDLCASLFERNHIQYAAFNSPPDMLNAKWDDAVKFVLIDIRMPGMSGIELCKLMRKKMPGHVCVYALTAQVLPGEQEFVLSQGFNGLLMKPFKEADLLALFNPVAGGAGKPGPDIKIDTTMVERMAFGDKNQLKKILHSFVNDSEYDIAALTLSMKDKDDEGTVLIVHRIAGRTAQIGASALATGFRLAEMELHQGMALSDEKISAILSLTGKLQVLVNQIKKDYHITEKVM